MARTTISRELRIAAPPDHVFTAFTNATSLREWLCDGAMVVPHPGGRIHLWWVSGYYATGEYTKVIPNERVSFTWRGRGEPGETRVRLAISPDGNGSLLQLAHKGVGTGKKWAEAAAAIERGWETGLENLRSVLETGHDLRFTQRPMLGIMPDALTPEVAERLGVPVSRGTLVGGVVEGMGAQAAGLQGGDVIIRIGDDKTPDWAGLYAAVQGRRAGDEAEVTYYRGAEKCRAAMTLSARPIEEPPGTPAALAQALTASGEDFLSRLTAAFDGVSDEQAARPPAEGQWSALEVLAHLIASERHTHHSITSLVGGYEDWTDDWAGNLDIAHAGILAVFPTASALLKELRRNRAETWAMAAALPEEFVARKGSYWRLAFGLMDGGQHDEGHLAQVKEALAAGS
jgi:uncharacterized protein YndB with AHSA1/START domain